MAMTNDPKVMQEYMKYYEESILKQNYYRKNKYAKDFLYGNFVEMDKAPLPVVKIKPKLILQNEKIDIALAIKQLNEYQKELKNRADITLSRSEQQKCFEDIENSKKLQLSLSKIIDKLCELER